jgi:hypothetical protein
MFKWVCLGVATIFLAAVAWMLNDIRRDVRRTGDAVQTAGHTVNEQLPAILAKTRVTVEALGEGVPQITDTLVDVAADVRNLKEAIGKSSVSADIKQLAYGESLLQFVGASGGTVGLASDSGELRKAQPAREWANSARKDLLLYTMLTQTNEQLLGKMTSTKFGSPLSIRVGEAAAVQLIEWLKANHPATRSLFP